MNLKTIDNFIDGAFCTSSRTFEKRSPVNNQVIAHVAEASMADVDRAVTAGHQALKNGWGKLPIAERADLLYAVAHEINQRFDDSAIFTVHASDTTNFFQPLNNLINLLIV